MKIYSYKGCGTCRKALKWLDAKNIAYETIPIREQPPKIKELQRVLNKVKNIKRLFNTSGLEYRNLNMKEKLPTLSENEALLLLSKNGKLVKRPLLPEKGLVGFHEEEWVAAF